MAKLRSVLLYVAEGDIKLREGTAIEGFAAGMEQLPKLFTLGPMNKVCSYCGALHFAGESELCCFGGRVKLPSIGMPKFLRQLYTGEYPYSKCFLQNIRNLNSFFAMASLSANQQLLAHGMQIYKIPGEMCVNVSALYERGSNPSFANYYHYDTQEATDVRVATERGRHLNRGLLMQTDRTLRSHNTFCQMYLRFHGAYEEERDRLQLQGTREEPKMRMRIVQDAGIVENRPAYTPRTIERGRTRKTDRPHWLWRARRLAQQFAVYNHVCIEAARLDYISRNCERMRSDEGEDLFRKVTDDSLAKDNLKFGKVIVLPGTYPGIPRNLQRCFEDSIAMVGEEIFGAVVGFAYNTKFQKRGLQHVHLLLCVDRAKQVWAPEDIDRVIEAYIPPLPQRDDEDREGKLELRRLVLRHMIRHSCANSNLPCQSGKGFCTKGFPKSYNECTYVAANGYAQLNRGY
uniref:Helitron_like_N domain-containing protein n=1 Tax=Ascaris lumbricoides TaxID=6252 RepID=A0A0M3IDC5_ASCLU